MYRRLICLVLFLFLVGCSNDTPSLTSTTRIAMPTAPSFYVDPTVTIPSPIINDTPASTATLTTTEIIPGDPTGTVTPCPIPTEWVPYTVQANDSLFKIARWSRTTVDDLVAGNCVANRDRLAIGQTIYVPHEILPTATPTHTPPPSSVTPTATSMPPTEDPLTIIRFTASPEVVKTGDEIKLEWEVTGVDEIYLLSYSGLDRFGYTLLNGGDPLPPTGTLIVQAPAYIRRAQYSMGFGSAPENLRVVTINCVDEYFVDVDLQTCPQGPVEVREAAYQPFEHGFMVWFDDNILVFSANTASSQFFGDSWDETPIDIDEEPPEGLFMPIRGFGSVWSQNGWVQDELGWATAPEQGYNMEIQETQFSYAARAFLFSLPTEQTIRADRVFDGSLIWQYVERR